MAGFIKLELNRATANSLTPCRALQALILLGASKEALSPSFVPTFLPSFQMESITWPQNIDIRPQNIHIWPQSIDFWPQDVNNWPKNIDILPQNINIWPQSIDIWSPNIDIWPKEWFKTQAPLGVFRSERPVSTIFPPYIIPNGAYERIKHFQRYPPFKAFSEGLFAQNQI